MKIFLPLLFIALSYSPIYAQSLQFENLSEVDDRLKGQGTVQGTLDETPGDEQLNLIIDYKDLSLPLSRAHIHIGTVEEPGKPLVQLNPVNDEQTTMGQMTRTLEIVEVALNKDQSKAQVTLNLNGQLFGIIAEAIKDDNACIVLEVETKAGYQTILAGPLRLAAPAPLVPTMSQWSLFILALIMASIGIVMLGRRETIYS